MKRTIVVSAALLLVGARMVWKERRRRAGLRRQQVQLQTWEGEGGRAEDAISPPVSPVSASDL